MSLREQVDQNIKDLLDTELEIVDGRVVPKSEDLTLKSGARKLDATYMYADMADSTGLAQGYKNWAAAKVVRTYVSTATRIMRHHGGEIRSFDGDRVMGIFIGDRKNNNAVAAALHLNHAAVKILRPAYTAKWSDFKWTLNHGIGIDTGEALIVRAGVRDNNDLVSIGRAPNVAAKLSEKRGAAINVTKSVYSFLDGRRKFNNDAEDVNMWTAAGSLMFGANKVEYYTCTWMQSF